MTENPKTRKTYIRLDVVSSYLASGMAVTVFTEVFNKSDIFRPLRKRHGPVEAEKLDRWANICMEVGDD